MTGQSTHESTGRSARTTPQLSASSFADEGGPFIRRQVRSHRPVEAPDADRETARQMPIAALMAASAVDEVSLETIPPATKSVEGNSIAGPTESPVASPGPGLDFIAGLSASPLADLVAREEEAFFIPETHETLHGTDVTRVLLTGAAPTLVFLPQKGVPAAPVATLVASDAGVAPSARAGAGADDKLSGYLMGVHEASMPNAGPAESSSNSSTEDVYSPKEAARIDSKSAELMVVAFISSGLYHTYARSAHAGVAKSRS